MLKISSGQLSAFAASHETGFLQKIGAFVAEWRPGALTDLAQVRSVVARARSWGLETELDIVHFALAEAYLGPSFDADPAIRDRLLDAARPGDKRALLARLITRLGQGAG